MAEQSRDFDLIIIGSGPGGYVGAIRAAQLGLKTAVIEKDKLGGVCLNIGCIPSKALIHQAAQYLSAEGLEAMGLKIDRSGLDYEKVFQASRKAADTLSKGVEFLFRKNNVTAIKGRARLSGPHEVKVEEDGGKTRTLSAGSIILATGSRPRQIKGFETDEKTVMTSDGFLMLNKLPKSMLVLGSGYIGMEAAFVASAFGVEVHVVELLDQILPLEDADAVAVLTRMMRRRGVKFLPATKAVGLKRTKDGLEVALEDKSGKSQAANVESVLVAVGRQCNIEDIGLEQVGVKTTDRGFVAVGDYYETSVKGIYAIGDLTPSPMLAHLASKEGEIAVEHIAGRQPRHKRVDPLTVPMVVYTEPQLASFGHNERTAKAAGVEYKAATFPFKGIGKAVATGDAQGQAKVLLSPKTGEILGAQIVGPEATELIHELLLAKSAELLAEDVAEMIHAHPTLSEINREVMLAALGRAIHA